MTLHSRSSVRPTHPAYSTGACDDPSIGGSPEHSRAVDDARLLWQLDLRMARPPKPHVMVRGTVWHVVDPPRTIQGPSIRWCSEFLKNLKQS